ncbi:MAG: ABC transporter substrate-binding protein [Desulfobacteraceae bacterium]|nr:ABC transporter substrate-binding protein [Desulfobacteraceae bacterium]MCG2831313.1 ABC transporter substrate-binding protein [Desulfobacteraceae bacterium]
MKQIRMNTLITLIVAFIITIALTFSACTTEKGKEPNAVKIGAILPLTGNLSFLGTPGKNAIELFKQQNKDNKAEIKLYDSKADPKTALTEFRRAYDFDNVRFFITTLTGVSLGVKPVAKDKRALQASIAIYPDIAAESDLAFQFCYNAISEATAICSYINDNAYQKIFVFASRDAVTEVELEKYILPSLKSAEVKCVVESFDVGTKDFKQIVAKFKASDASHAVLLGYGSDFQGILRELANQKLIDQVKVIGGVGYLELPNYIEYSLVKNSVFVSPKFLTQENNNELYNKFKGAYQKVYGIVPTYDAAYTYDTITAISSAAKNVSSLSPELVAEYLKKNTIPGVTGPIAFTSSGQLKVDVVMAKYNRDFSILMSGEER